MKNQFISQRLIVMAVATINTSFAFVLLPPSRQSYLVGSRSLSNLHVKFDGDKWIPEAQEEKPSAGYGIFNTIILQGPMPAARRVFQPFDYEQAVLKFMAQEKCDRNTAQGNMDCYLRNPDDWMYLRMNQEQTGVPYDFVTVDTRKITLVTFWSGLLALFVQQFLARVESGEIDFSKNHQFDFLQETDLMDYFAERAQAFASTFHIID